MASQFVSEVFEKLREQVNNMGLDEKSKNKFLMDEWKRWCDKEERKEKREAEKEKREAEEARQKQEEAQRQREIELEEAQRQREFELEKLKLEVEAKKLERAQQDANRDAVSRPLGKVKSPELPSFVDGKDDLDSYLLRFERYAVVAKWEKASWATHISALLSGKALDVYSRLSEDLALNYDRLKTALLNRYNYTEHGYRQRFREATPEGSESPGQFIVRLRNYFGKWVELSEVQ